MLTATDFKNFITEASKLEHRSVHLDGAIAHAREIVVRLEDHGKTLALRVQAVEAELKNPVPTSATDKTAALAKLKTAAATFAPKTESAPATS